MSVNYLPFIVFQFNLKLQKKRNSLKTNKTIPITSMPSLEYLFLLLCFV
jgi:hypothetical protein